MRKISISMLAFAAVIGFAGAANAGSNPPNSAVTAKSYVDQLYSLNKTAVANEEARAANAEGLLETAIGAEKTRAEGVEGTTTNTQFKADGVFYDKTNSKAYDLATAIAKTYEKATSASSSAESNAKKYTDDSIAKLDAKVEQETGDLTLKVFEEDGKLTAVSGSINDGAVTNDKLSDQGQKGEYLTVNDSGDLVWKTIATGVDGNNEDVITSKAVNTAIEAVKQAYAEADTTLSGNIGAEKKAREDADTALEGKITDEATDRENADAGLKELIETESQTREGADTAIKADLAKETTDRKAADKAINTTIGEWNETVKEKLGADVVTAINTAFSNNSTNAAAITTLLGSSSTITGDATGTLEFAEGKLKNMTLTIPDDTITTSKIKDGEVKSADIGEGEVKTDNIGAAQVTGAKLSTTNCDEGQVMIYNGGTMTCLNVVSYDGTNYHNTESSSTNYVAYNSQGMEK